MRWVSQDTPDLIIIKVLMQNRLQWEMDIADPEEQLIDFYLDLSKLAGVKPWYPKGSDEPSKTECLCDFVGIDQVILYITIDQIMEAWIFYKTFKKQ